MSRWVPTKADRNAQGRIRVPGLDTPARDDTAFAATLNDSLAAVGATPPAAAETTEAPPTQRSYTHIALALLAGVLLTLALLALTRLSPSPAPTRPAPTASVAPATTLPTAPAVSPLAILPRAIVAYAAPDGAVLGAIPAPTAAVARYGNDWAQVAHEGGTVWVRASDIPDLMIATLPDLAPPPTATPAPSPLADTPFPAVQLPPAPTVCATSVAGMGCGANAGTAISNLQIIETTSAVHLATSAALLDVTMTTLAAEQATATALSGRP